ncbi:pre-mRNA-splicing factor PRP46 [Helianthus annuus]|uniref:pre-mRNA-splicing factor PRP46 n=1 Tax=Helianthus annuus TaxID=4232 RepID=UPI000B8FBB4D|nr:pre-mRNA-splicing factor PRP46 [Helianthus annuus]XP_035830674.1 pre-mRNA-splicing factor PRP46 [Helianthus annuus]
MEIYTTSAKTLLDETDLSLRKIEELHVQLQALEKQKVISGHLGWVRSVAFSPNNEWFCTGSADRTIKIWDTGSGRLRLTLTGHIEQVRGTLLLFFMHTLVFPLLTLQGKLLMLFCKMLLIRVSFTLKGIVYLPLKTICSR